MFGAIEKIWQDYLSTKKPIVDKAFLLALQEYGTKEIVGPKHNPEVLKYFHEAGFPQINDDETSWCLKGDLEILTDKGFIQFKDAITKTNVDFKVAQVNTENQSIEFVSDFVWIIKKHEGEVFHVNKPSVSLICDGSHEFYGKWSSSKKYTKRKISLMSSYGVGIPVITAGQKDHHPITDVELKLLAAFLSDGHKRFNRITFNVSKERKIEVLQTLNPKWSKIDKVSYKNRKVLTRFSFDFPKIFKTVLLDYKVLSWDFIKALSQRQCKLFTDTYSKFDGTPLQGGFNLFTGCDKLAENLMYIATMAGYKVTSHKVKQVSRNTNIEYLNTIYVSVNNKHRYIQPSNVHKEKYDGFLYCASVPSGLIVIRDYNNNIFVVGNCAAFMNWCQMKADRPGTKSLSARSWMNWGEPVFEPEIGDVAIFWRNDPNSWQGHVAFYVKHTGTQVYVLGGNQSNMVNIAAYPGTQLLGYRRYKT